MQAGIALRDTYISAPTGAELIDRIASRRSTPPRQLFEPGPSEREIERMVHAACAAPDHKGLQPFRFEWIGIEERHRLADVFEAAERELRPHAPAEAFERERERAMHAPILLAVIVRLTEGDVPATEQFASAGAALGYVLLAADALGYGAMAVSGEKLATATIRRAFGLAANETLLCFIGMGTPGKLRPPRSAPELASRLWRWQPPSG
jgi:nitroreductase